MLNHYIPTVGITIRPGHDNNVARWYVLDQLSRGGCTHSELALPQGADGASALWHDAGMISRACQWLRKTGLIRFDHKRWHLTVKGHGMLVTAKRNAPAF